MRNTFVAAAAAFGTLVLALCAHTRAAPITFQGSTTGAFNGGVAMSSASLSGLTFQNSSYNVTTNADGFAAIGNAPATGPGGTNVDNLGSFSLADSAASYSGNTFTLNVSVTGTSGDPTQNVTIGSTLTGAVTTPDQGGVLIDFGSSNPVIFHYFDGTQLNEVRLTVNDTSVTPDGLVPITGQILVTVIPEPSTALLGGLGIMALASRRRRIAK